MSSDETRSGDEGETRTGDERETPAGTEDREDPLNRVLKEIRDSEKRTERRLKRLESDVQRSQQEALEKAAKKAKREKPYAFKKKSHQVQFDFNEQVTERIDNARDELKKRPAHGAAVDRALKALDEGIELLATRQKLIKIADRSELGWKVVEEYEADELASGSEDEKKLERAERTAERKAVKRRKATTRQGPRSYPGKFRQPPFGGVSQSRIGLGTRTFSQPRYK